MAVRIKARGGQSDGPAVMRPDLGGAALRAKLQLSSRWARKGGAGSGAWPLSNGGIGEAGRPSPQGALSPATIIPLRQLLQMVLA